MVDLTDLSFSYAAYGLNKYRSFFDMDECDCGEMATFEADSDEELFSFVLDVFDESGYDNCAMFIVDMNGVPRVCLREEPNTNTLNITVGKPGDVELFSEVDGDLLFDRYGLLMQNPNGTWTIINN